MYMTVVFFFPTNPHLSSHRKRKDAYMNLSTLTHRTRKEKGSLKVFHLRDLFHIKPDLSPNFKTLTTVSLHPLRQQQTQFSIWDTSSSLLPIWNRVTLPAILALASGKLTQRKQTLTLHVIQDGNVGFHLLHEPIPHLERD